MTLTNEQIPPIVLMGVAGSGKSTVGELLGTALDVPFIDGDVLHPDGNVEKMRAGRPLDDDDRLPWLHRIGELIDAGVVEGHSTIVACSALKRAYRDLLRRHAPDLLFVHLEGERTLLERRLALRQHEYMPASLLDSQLETLEPLQPDERGLAVGVDAPPQRIVDDIRQSLAASAAHG